MTQDLLHIDGSQGEGGGQILRSALALSMALGRPFRITGIRANRPKPGLMRQHLTAVHAAAEICSARVHGAAPASRELTFTPGPIRAGDYHFAVGTAGSTTLVLQAILPALLVAPCPSSVVVEGGTHARWAPPFEFLEGALLPVLNRMGHRVQARLERHGFYPAGGGRIRVDIAPARAPTPLRLESRGEVRSRTAAILLSKLPFDIAERELTAIRDALGWEVGPTNVQTLHNALSPGNCVTLRLECEHVTEVFCALGELGKPASAVAAEATDAAREYLAAAAPVGRHLADQLMVPLAIAAAQGAGECSFLSLPFTPHSSTNSAVVGEFLGQEPSVERRGRLMRWSVVGYPSSTSTRPTD